MCCRRLEESPTASGFTRGSSAANTETANSARTKPDARRRATDIEVSLVRAGERQDNIVESDRVWQGRNRPTRIPGKPVVSGFRVDSNEELVGWSWCSQSSSEAKQWCGRSPLTLAEVRKRAP